jgi:hypothetical protein
MLEVDDLFKEQKLQQLKLYIYLIPVLGLLPALWSLYDRNSTREEKKIGRLSVNLALIWFVAYVLLWTTATQVSDVFAFRLLFINSLVTSGYFLASALLIIRLWQGKSARLPGINYIIPQFKDRRQNDKTCNRSNSK